MAVSGIVGNVAAIENGEFIGHGLVAYVDLRGDDLFLHRVLEDERPVRRGEERVHLVPLRVEGDRVRSLLRRLRLHALQGVRVYHVDHAGVADRTD